VLRQLARLARSVPFAGERALAIAVYGDAANQLVPAREAGYEGVACVDDAARALELYCDLWQATQLPWTLRWCEGLLDFLLAMQQEDGLWINFIVDWDGTPNRQGPTSVAGGAFWQARALLALSRSSRTISDERIGVALQRGLPHMVEATDVPSDVRALHILTAISLLEDGGDDDGWRDLLGRWSDEVMSCRDGDTLLNSVSESGRPHLWGHIQEGVLAEAGDRLGRDDLIGAARRSAELVFADAVATGFDLPRTQPYDVASTVFVMVRLGAVTGALEYQAAADNARRWFDGRNPAGARVYDRSTGRVADGVDGRTVSMHSGAEANIVAAQTLLADVVTQVTTRDEAEMRAPGVR
jgi:hypothetical protein